MWGPSVFWFTAKDKEEKFCCPCCQINLMLAVVAMSYEEEAEANNAVSYIVPILGEING